MNSSMIGKIEKAHRYAREPERIRFQALTATFHGGHDNYEVTLSGDEWRCTCHTFESHAVGTCSHVMAMQHVLGPMLSAEAKYGHESLTPEPALTASP